MTAFVEFATTLKDQLLFLNTGLCGPRGKVSWTFGSCFARERAGLGAGLGGVPGVRHLLCLILKKPE